MSNTAFLAEAQTVAERNLTSNVEGVSASFDDGHLSVTYYLATEPTIGDEEWRELTLTELISAFPGVKTADAYSEVATAPIKPLRNEHLVFQRQK